MPPRLHITRPLIELELLRTQLRRESNARVKDRIRILLAYHEYVPIQTICTLYCVNRNYPAYWVKCFNAAGLQGLYDQPRPGAPPKITTQALATLVQDPPPTYGYNLQGWTPRLLRVVLETKCGIKYALRSIYAVIQRCGQALIMPSTHHYRADPVKQQAWARTTAPELLKHPETLVIQDETTSRIATTLRKVIAPKGSKPTIAVKVGKYDARWNVYISYFVAAQKVVIDLQQSLHPRAMKQHLRSVKKAWGTGRIDLVLDGSGTHQGEDLTYFCRKKGVHCHLLPPYSPLMNPVEEINRQLKDYLALKVFASIEELKTEIIQFFQDHHFMFDLNVEKYFFKPLTHTA